MRQFKDINMLLALAEQGDNRAQRKLASRYYYGCGGVEQNYEEAAKWSKTADFQWLIGRCYLYGRGVDKDYKEAVKCFIAADDKDMLGECYLHGLGVERNINKTVELWENACEERCRYYDVMLKLAHLYGDGIEMEPDYEKALNWWFQLAENDMGEFGQQGAFSEAMYQIACYHYEGKGVKKNLKLALKCFKYTIDLFYYNQSQGEVSYAEYDRENHLMKYHTIKVDDESTVSEEPDFIVRSRKILAAHGRKSTINKIKKDAQKGDVKAVEILKEFGIEIVISKQDESVSEEFAEETFSAEEAEWKTPIELVVGETVTHIIYGDGVICEADEGVVCIEFVSVGKKKFLNPEAFLCGYLSLSRRI